MKHWTSMWLVVAGLHVAACGRNAAPVADTAGPATTVVAVAAAPDGSSSNDIDMEVVRRTSKGRVVALGDLHGDLTATRAALRLAGAIDAQDRWIGGNLFVVQVGDQLDRGDDEPEILALLERLGKEAEALGGAVIVLNGNHEYMNIAGDLRYVTGDGMADWGGAEKRATAFAPGGPEAQRIATRPLYAIVDDTLYAHAGVLPAHLDAGLEKLDNAARAWARGESKAPPAVVRDPEGPLWTRRYGRAPGPDDCAAATMVLQRLGLKRMVVGHSPQPGINAACDGRVWRVDVGLAAHYGGPVEVLLLEGGAARVLKRGQDSAPVP